MKSTKINFALAWVLSLSAVGLAGTAMAQENGQANDDVIIVTGERMQRTEMDTASSITVLTGAEIEDLSLEDIADILNVIPNVTTGVDGGGFRIRGISNTSVTGGGDGGLATIYVDGAPLSQFSAGFGPTDTWDLGSVEVFRGAQSTNLGRDSLAGAIILRSADPVYDMKYKGRVRVEGHGGLTLSAVVNVPIIEDKLAVRIAIDRKQHDGFITNTTLNTDKYQASESLLVRGKILFEPTADFRNILTVTHTENERGSSDVVGPNFFDRIATDSVPPKNDLDQTIVTWEAEYQINDQWAFSNVISYNEADYDQLGGNDDITLGRVDKRSRINSINTLTEEARIFYTGDRLRAALGGYYAKENEDNTRSVVTTSDVEANLRGPLGPALAVLFAGFYPNPFFIDGTATNIDETENYAAFANADYDLSELVTLNLGLRYDHESKVFNGNQSLNFISDLPDPATVPAPFAPTVAVLNAAFAALEGNTPEMVDTSYDAWLPQAGLVLHVSDGFTTTLQAKRAYRAGGGGSAIGLGFYSFDPEYAWTFEAGIRKTIMGGLGLFKANVYSSKWNDMQVIQEVPNVGGAFFVDNAAEAKLKGFELELSLDPTDEWAIFANLGYSDTEFVKYITSAGTDLSGNNFIGASPWTISTGASWHGDNGLFAQTHVSYQSKAPTNAANSNFADSRVLMNGKVGYKWNNIEANVFVRNGFDAEYVSNRTSVSTTVGRPRVFGLELKISN
ncbi:MAG: hypothetical protein COA69_07515 [Robiginitomaculum sp.]|nr:MAG: hypothetical protein COA69_07515 [Robiginitomaculum sp.]